MWVLYVLLWISVAYAALVAAFALAQRRLIFPAYLVPARGGELPRHGRRVEVTAADGTRLAGVLFPPTLADTDADILLLGFGGNVWDVEAMSLSLIAQFPKMHVAGFHYRGYGPSGGRAGADPILADALTVFDFLGRDLADLRVVPIGFSIGSPVAAYLARHRPVSGVVLVTPFDSLVELARDHFPWLPVRLFLRHRMPTLDFMRGLQVPAAIISAERDSVVPARRTEPLRNGVANLVFDRVIGGAEHNDLYDRPEFWSALREAVAAVLRSPRQ